jgi:hypothetical protein
MLDPMTLTASLRTQTRFAFQNLMAAGSFSRRVQVVEKANAGASLGGFFDEILWNATASIFCTAAGLEAYANEVFEDRSKHFPQLSGRVVGEVWRMAEDRSSLDKLSLALGLLDRPDFEKGGKPYQDAAALIRLRNALMHFKPEWDDAAENHTKLASKLMYLFDGSPFFPEGETLFPRRWATHSCTAWAISSTIATMRDFEQRAGISTHLTDRFDRIEFSER